MSAYLRSIGALYATNYVRRLKKCHYCDTEFSDISQRNLMNTCTVEHRTALMVATRKSNGSFAQSEEHIEKRMLSLAKTRSERDVYTPEVRAVLSETMKRTWALKRIDTSKHWTKTPEGKAKLSKLYKGCTQSIAARHNMSLAQQKRLRSRRETNYTTAHGGRRDDLNCYFRSNWEANFARILNLQDVKWLYEHQTFQVTETMSYTPDFYLPDEDLFYELKGRMDEKSKLQLELMSTKFPHIKIKVIDGVFYDQLKLTFKQKLSETWEGK